MALKFNNLFRSNESKFCLSSATFFALIPLISFMFTSYVLWIFMDMTHAFFESNGYPEIQALKEAYFDYITQDIFQIIPYTALFLIVLFFAGYYISKLLLRPFEDIEKCIDMAVFQPDKEIYPRSIYGLGPLTSFSHLFFKYVHDYRNGKLNGNVEIPEKYAKVNSPQFDLNYFTTCLLFVVIFSGVNSFLIYIITSDIHANMIQLAVQTLNQKKYLAQFLSSQDNILYSCQMISFFLMFILYTVFIYTRFLRVTGPAYAFFRSMKHFMQGEKHTVYLRSYDPVHKQADKLNNFIDIIMKEKKK